MDEGYTIIRECIPPSMLEGLRETFETLVGRQRETWARDRKPGDPPGGLWETHNQPRVSFEEVADRKTANAIEFCLHENTLGVSRRLISGREVGLHQMALMCNPVNDHPGGTGWHRDTGPDSDVPLQGIQQDMAANGPGYVQWNIPLYDDNVLMIVPGSHRRRNTEAEDRQLREDRYADLPGAIPVELKAGDGAVYVNHILHSGSNYSTRLRRTIHIAYQSFGGELLRYFHLWWNLGFADDLPAEVRGPFESWDRAIRGRHDTMELFYRALIDKDLAGFRSALGQLHSGEQGRMACVVLLCKVAQIVHRVTRTGFSELPADQQRRVVSPKQLYLYEDVARRFSPDELEVIWSRFGPLDARLKKESTQGQAGARTEPTRYRSYEMPSDYGVEDFVESWAGREA
jgi:hypothetical protein